MSDSARQPPFFRQQTALTLKELRETLRDRRTTLTLILMPVLLYPLLGLGFRFSTTQFDRNQPPEYRIAVENDEDARWVMRALGEGDELFHQQQDTSLVAPKVECVIPDQPTGFDLNQLVAAGEVELGVRVQRSPVLPAGLKTAVQLEIIQRAGATLSRDAALFVRERMQLLNLAHVQSRVSQNDPGFQFEVLDKVVSVTPTGESTAILSLLPMVLLLMTVTGGVYPAIDLTAGERERNTLETLMALPVPRIQLLLAKFAAVVTVTVMTGIMNLLAMAITVYSLQLEKTLFGSQGLTVSLAFSLFCIQIVFAVFYSAVLLLVTSSARSFKEAQAYLIPILLLSIAPGLVIMLPGWSLNRGTAVFPIVNILLAARGILEGDVSWSLVALSMISTGMYSFAALAGATHTFGNDAVDVGSQRRWSELFHRPTRTDGIASLPTAIATLAALFSLYFVSSSLLDRVSVGVSMTRRLQFSAVLTALLFAGVPLAVARWRRISVVTGFQLRAPRMLDGMGAAVLGISAWPWIFEVVVLLQAWFPRTLDPNRFTEIQMMLDAWKAVPPIYTILALGVVPGICEEFFFRGFLLSSLRQHLSGTACIVLTAVAFGFFHIVLTGGVAPERLIPSTLMGLLLGWVALRTGSVLPGMLLHATHNSLLLWIAIERDAISSFGLGVESASHLPGSWLLAAITGLILGVSLIVRQRNKVQIAREGSGHTP